MMSGFLKSQFDKFGRQYDYDTGYMKEVADLDAGGAMKLGMMAPFTSHRFGIGAAPYFAAKVTAARWADCGSCLRLAIAMAVEAGLARADLAAMLTGQKNVPEDMALAARYAQAVIDNSPELTEIIAECERRWGRSGIAGLSAATVSGLVYPLFKRGLGYGNVCEPVIAALEVETRHVPAELMNG